MGLITEENLPQILGAVLGINTVYILRDVWRNWRWWRKGVSTKEKDAIALTLNQLAQCHEDLDETQEERDRYLRQVGRRDYIILMNGLQIPRDDLEGAPHE